MVVKKNKTVKKQSQKRLGDKLGKKQEKKNNKEIINNVCVNNINKNNLQSNNSNNKQMIETELLEDCIITECSNEARILQDKSCFGTLLDDGRVQLTLIEGYYLYEKKKIIVKKGKKILEKEQLLKKCLKLETNFLIRYAVYSDFRNRGYVIKTALKFGADFRVYNKGIKPGEDHARWIVYPVKETGVLTWYEFAAKNRVAHSTKKRLLLGIVDEENSVTYYEVKWVRP
jgi:tRNA-intron endonuclease, archaea type